ncbi:MAG: Gfo/Idh/MocA family oxidoreductase [Planctomycetota bacterium]|nr:MAG: Gfo/Idh/MocA family oxidoreductase [Planctomycetota bacterium]
MSARRRLRMGMVGGGPGAFIGAVHRICLAMDGEFTLVAGAFSSDPEKSRQTGAELGLEPARVYGSWEEMAAREAALPAEVRIDAVSIVTPNHVHHGPAIEFLRRGFHVICDKPLTTDSRRAAQMAAAVRKSKRVFALTHNYTGYPMVREARELVRGGKIGQVRKVYAEYLQGWLADPLEKSGQKQASWRVDPKRSGPGGSLGDIGTHAFNLLEHVTGQRVKRLYGKRSSFVPGRKVDDDAMVLLELGGGGNGTLCCSQVCVGEENGLRLRVYGTEGGIEWHQHHPNDLKIYWKDRAPEIRRAANGYLTPSARSLARVPPGHPEGYLEGFANIYRAFARAIRGQKDIEDSFPTVQEGVRGVRFIEAVIASSRRKSWVGLR